MQPVLGVDLFVKLAGFILLEPDTNQVAADVLRPGKAVEQSTPMVLLDDLVFEGGAVAAVTAHGPSLQ